MYEKRVEATRVAISITGVIAFVMTLGSVGACDIDNISLGQCMLQIVIAWSLIPVSGFVAWCSVAIIHNIKIDIKKIAKLFGGRK